MRIPICVDVSGVGCDAVKSILEKPRKTLKEEGSALYSSQSAPIMGDCEVHGIPTRMLERWGNVAVAVDNN